MAMSEFKSAIIRCTYEDGLDENGRVRKKIKNYHNVTDTAAATEIFAVAAVLTNLGTKPLMFLEKQSSQTIYE